MKKKRIEERIKKLRRPVPPEAVKVRMQILCSSCKKRGTCPFKQVEYVSRSIYCMTYQQLLASHSSGNIFVKPACELISVWQADTVKEITAELAVRIVDDSYASSGFTDVRLDNLSEMLSTQQN